MKMIKKTSVLCFCMLSGVCFAKPVNEIKVWFDNQLFQRFSYEVQGEYAVTEGDIILGKLNDILRPGAVVTNHSETRWPKGLIPFELDSSVSIATKASIFLAFVHYQKWSSIRFVERTVDNQAEYPDYVKFKSGDGCSSYVGKIGGSQAITLNAACSYGSIIHEIGHALGFWHEQNRLDRDDYVSINFDNVSSAYKHNFTQHPDSSVNLGSYDYGSIMHYGAYAFSKNGKKTINVLRGKHAIGQHNGLSYGDVSAIKKMYG